MTAPVEFGLALSNSYPSGTGSYNYDGSFKIVVQNLAFNKQVSIWAQVGATWKDIYASHVQSLPGNLELWSASKQRRGRVRGQVHGERHNVLG